MNVGVKVLDKQERKKYIAEKTLELINEKGLTNITMEEVASSCNLSKGSIYNYFKNKNALIVSAFSVLLEKVQKIFEEKESKPTQDCVEASAELYANLYSEILNTFPSKELMRLFEILMNSTHDQSMMQILTQTFKANYGKILSRFEKLFTSKTKAFMLQAMFDGLVIYRAVGIEFSNDEIKNNFKKMILSFTEDNKN
ncbi:MAG TPA: hypothetical protein DCP10_03230 [Bacteroidales bacterium]|nr:MAG: Transcriptional regulator, TetR family [Petrotoga mobilis]HAL64567.1 hypothetical protein [Bacteroidales bacterium]